jgi:hypothetical protein
VPDHLLRWVAGAVAGCAATIAVAIATRVRLLPEVVDVSIVPTVAGVFSILFAAVGAVRRYPSERLGRLTLFGTLLGAAIASLYLVGALLIGVLS